MSSPTSSQTTSRPAAAVASDVPSTSSWNGAGSVEPTPTPTGGAATIEPTVLPSTAQTLDPTAYPTSGPTDQAPTSGSGSNWGHIVGLRPQNPKSPTAAPAAADDMAPTLPPDTSASDPTASSPSALISAGNSSDFDCSSYSVSYERMCESANPCCEAKRSDSDFCWDLYENIFPGDLIYTACNECCQGGPRTIGPPTPERDDLPKTIQCSSIENPYRMCKSDSCCENPRSTSSYCLDVYDTFGESMEELCVSTEAQLTRTMWLYEVSHLTRVLSLSGFSTTVARSPRK